MLHMRGNIMDSSGSISRHYILRPTIDIWHREMKFLKK